MVSVRTLLIPCRPLWASQVHRRTADHVYLEEEIETVEGPIHRLILVDGHEPSPLERKQNDDRLRDLMQNPKTPLTAKNNRETAERKFGELLRVMPDIFLYEDQGNQRGLGDLSGFDVATRLRDRPSRAKIIFLSIHEDVEFVTAGFDIGACGYIFKSRVVEDLRKAIEMVYAGGRFVSPTSRFIP